MLWVTVTKKSYPLLHVDTFLLFSRAQNKGNILSYHLCDVLDIFFGGKGDKSIPAKKQNACINQNTTTIQCVVPENIYTPLSTEGIGNSWGVQGQRSRNFLRGGGQKILLHHRVYKTDSWSLT